MNRDGHRQLTKSLGLLAEEVQRREEAFGGGCIQRAAAGFDAVALAVGVEVAEGFAVGKDADQGADGGGEAGQGGGVLLVGVGVGERPVGTRERVGRDARIVMRDCRMIGLSHDQLLASWLWSAGRMGCCPCGPRCFGSCGFPSVAVFSGRQRLRCGGFHFKATGK